MGKLRPTMTPEDLPSPSGPPSGPARPRARRSRRGGRGRRRPGPPRADDVPAAVPPVTDESGEVFPVNDEPMTADAPLPDSEIEEARREVAETGMVEESESREEFSAPERAPREERAPVPERRDFKPATPAAVTECIEEVNRIMTSLRQVLDTMEEILETLELAEVQKTADEREIQSLRNALRQMDRRGPEPRREPEDAQPHPQPRRDPRRPGRR
jgi:hypothetical protein